MSIYIIIPARKNSQRLKMKNKLKIGRNTLVERAVNFANKINFSKKIIFTSDDNYNLKKNKKLLVLKRPKNLAKNNSKMFPVITNAINTLKSNNSNESSVLLLQPTSPFRSLKLIKQAFILFKRHNYKDSVVCVSKKINKNKKSTFKIKKNLLKRSYYLCPKKKYLYEVNGNFYFASLKFLIKHRTFVVSGKTIPVVSNNKKIKIDIDTKNDYLTAKSYI